MAEPSTAEPAGGAEASRPQEDKRGEANGDKDRETQKHGYAILSGSETTSN